VTLALLGSAACASNASRQVETQPAPSSVSARAEFFEPAPPPTDSLRVLFIGNSYTYVNDLPGQIQRLAASSEGALPLIVNQVTPGGATLERNWEEGRARRLIRLGGWSHVVLQEQSTRPIEDREKFFTYARRFDAEIKGVGAKTVLYLTWARDTLPETQATLTEAYEDLAEELGAIIAPVGPAWAEVAARGAEVSLYYKDGSHPSPNGSYLAACVFFATLYGESPEGLPARPLTTLPSPGTAAASRGGALARRPGREESPLTDATAALLQRTAWEVVSRHASVP